MIDSHPLRRMTMTRLLKTLDRQCIVIEVPAATHLNGGPPSELPFKLVVLGLGGRSFSDPLATLEVAAARDTLSGTPLVIISDHDEAEEIRQAIVAGVQGFLPTSLRPEVAVGALELVLAGGEYFPKMVIAPAPPSGPPAASGGPPAGDVPKQAPYGWTSRELDVGERLRSGESNKVIARALGLQESTIKIYVRRIRRKLGAANRTQAALLLSRRADEPEAKSNGRPAPGGGPTESKIELKSKRVPPDHGD